MAEDNSDRTPSQRAQMIGSLLVALAIVVITVALVTAKIGPGIDTREKREELEEIQEEREELDELREERREERQEAREEAGAN